MKPENFLLKIEDIFKNILLGFLALSIGITLVAIVIFYLSLMLSFNNVFLSLFMFGLLLIIHYIGKQITIQINDIEPQ